MIVYLSLCTNSSDTTGYHFHQDPIGFFGGGGGEGMTQMAKCSTSNSLFIVLHNAWWAFPMKQFCHQKQIKLPWKLILYPGLIGIWDPSECPCLIGRMHWLPTITPQSGLALPLWGSHQDQTDLLIIIYISIMLLWCVDYKTNCVLKSLLQRVLAWNWVNRS